jgi:hypothetical protein
MLTRNLTAYPYAGHTFVCNDIAGIADVQEAIDSALHVIEFGKPSQTGQMRLQNEGGIMREHPVLGNSDGMLIFPPFNFVKAAISLHPSLPRYTIVATVRLQGTDFTVDGRNGGGGQASWWEVGIGAYNAAGIPSFDLINRFFRNYTYYSNSYLGFGYTPTPVDLEWGPIAGTDIFKTVVITGTVNPALFVNNSENVGYIQFGLNYPLDSGGSLVWQPATITGGGLMTIAPAPHPITGIDLFCDGIVDFQIYLHK